MRNSRLVVSSPAAFSAARLEVNLTERWIEFHAGIWAKGQKGYLDEAAGLDEGVRKTVTSLLEKARGKLRTLQKGSKAARAAVAALGEKLSPPIEEEETG
jgi:hypothetical protein